MDRKRMRKDNRMTSGGLMKAGSLLAAACAAMPLFACGAHLFHTQSPLLWMAVPWIAFFLSLAVMLIPAEKVRPAVFAAVALTTLLSFFVPGGGLPGVVSGIACGALCFVCLSRRSCPAGREWGYFFWIAGLIAQLILWAMFSRGVFFTHPDYRSAASLSAAAACIFFLLFLLYLNRMTLIAGSHADITARGIPLVVRFRNTGAVIIVFLVSAAAGFSGGIGKAASLIWTGLKKVIGFVIRFIASFFSFVPSSGGMGGGEGEEQGFLPAGNAEQSLLSMILEKIVMVLAVILCLFLLAFALRALWKLSKKLFSLIRDRISLMLDRASEDYTETINDTRWDKQDEPVSKRFFRGSREARPANGNDLVRYLYRKFLKKHPDRQGMTCREALKGTAGAEDFAKLYERVRYGEEKVDINEPEALEAKLKNRT